MWVGRRGFPYRGSSTSSRRRPRRSTTHQPGCPGGILRWRRPRLRPQSGGLGSSGTAAAADRLPRCVNQFGRRRRQEPVTADNLAAALDVRPARVPPAFQKPCGGRSRRRLSWFASFAWVGCLSTEKAAACILRQPITMASICHGCGNMECTVAVHQEPASMYLCNYGRFVLYLFSSDRA